MEIIVPDSLREAEGVASDCDDFWCATLASFLRQIFANGHHLPPRFSLREILAHRYGVHLEELHEWKTGPVYDLSRKLHLSPYFNRTLPLFPGARRALHQIHAETKISFYITARPRSLQEVTERAITENALPFAPVFTRPPEVDLFIGSPAWKAAVLAQCPRVCGIMDDDPRLIGKLREDQLLFLFGPQPPWAVRLAERTKGVVLCPTYKTLVIETRRRFKNDHR